MSQRRIFSIGRRSFLAALGTGAGAATFLRPLIAEAEGALPQRFLYVHYPCGTVSGLTGEGQGSKWFWFPVGGAGPNYAPSPLLNLFSAVKDRVLPIDGIDLLDRNQMTVGDKHSQAMIAMGTGWMSVPNDNAPAEMDPANAKYITAAKGSKSIDQFILEKVPAVTAPLIAGGKGPQFPSIQLCGTAKSMANQGFTCLKVISYAGNGLPLFGEGRSLNAFTNIFGMATTGSTDPLVVQRQAAQKKSVLDFVMADINRLRPKIPNGQLPKLDAQLDSIRNLEARITTSASTTTLVKPMLATEPTMGHNGANPDEAAHATLIQNMLEIIRCAFLSDLTRVASITFADGNNPLNTKAFVPAPTFALSADGHSTSHAGKGADAILAKGEVVAMYTGLMADMLKNMLMTPEGTGTLLDNVVGMYFTECRDGDNHERKRNPALLFGGKFLKMNTGQYLVFPTTTQRYTNDVWVSMLNAWGVPTQTYGDPQYSKGVLPGLFGP